MFVWTARGVVCIYKMLWRVATIRYRDPLRRRTIMLKQSILFVCAALMFVPATYGVVVGDFETGLDGWIPREWAPATTFSTEGMIGVTSGPEPQDRGTPCRLADFRLCQVPEHFGSQQPHGPEGRDCQLAGQQIPRVRHHRRCSGLSGPQRLVEC